VNGSFSVRDLHRERVVGDSELDNNLASDSEWPVTRPLTKKQQLCRDAEVNAQLLSGASIDANSDLINVHTWC
jgi:hypothetical protein